MSHDDAEFAEFFEASWDRCLRAVAASTGDVLLAEDQVAEAFARAWASWRKVSRHPAPRAWVVRTALNTGASCGNPNGTATLTINPDVLFEPSTLQNDLAQYGIPAMVTIGSFCSSDPAPAGFSQVVSFPPFQSDGGQEHATDHTITINPAVMPAGTELSFGNFQLPASQPTTIALIDKSSYACTSAAPTVLPPGGALLHYPLPGP